MGEGKLKFKKGSQQRFNRCRGPLKNTAVKERNLYFFQGRVLPCIDIHDPVTHLHTIPDRWYAKGLGTVWFYSRYLIGAGFNNITIAFQVIDLEFHLVYKMLRSVRYR